MILTEDAMKQTILLGDNLILTEGDSPDFKSLSSCCIICLSGFAGTGKTTLMNHLISSFPNMALLPSRRELTQKYIVEPLMKERGLEVVKLTRDERYSYVREFKSKNPEGVGFVLSTLKIKKSYSEWLLFDGLRGLVEIQGFLKDFPNSLVVHLSANESTRAERINRRSESHDQSPMGNVNGAEIAKKDTLLHGEVDVKTLKHERLLSINTNKVNEQNTWSSTLQFINENWNEDRG